MILGMSPKMDMILVDFSQDIVWPEVTKIITHNGKQNLLFCHTHLILLMFLQGVSVESKICGT